MKPRQRKPFGQYDPQRPYKPRTEAQKKAMRIMRARGLYYHSYILTGWRRLAMQALVDDELCAYGVETQTERHERTRAEFEAELLKDPK